MGLHALPPLTCIGDLNFDNILCIKIPESQAKNRITGYFKRFILSLFNFMIIIPPDKWSE